MDYFEARQERYKRNEKAIFELIRDVIKTDPQVKAYISNSDKIASHVTFFKGEEINSVSFHEVPYRWSGCGYKEHGGSNNNLEMPFDVNDVLTTFKPITSILDRQPNEYFKSKKQYLKWHSWLIQITLEDLSFIFNT
jgi:hypothetical protein